MDRCAHEIALERYVSLAEHPFVTRLSRLMKLERGRSQEPRTHRRERAAGRKAQDLVVVGDEYRNLCFVKDGYAIRYKLLRSGKRQILNVILPGDVIGFPVSFFDRSIYSVVAVSDLTYNICSLDSYVRLCYEQPQFGLALSWLAAHEAAIYAEHIVDLGRRTPIERLAHFLLEIHARLLAVGRAETTSFDLPFSQEVMADVLGLERAAPQSRHAAIARRTIDHQPVTSGRIDRHDEPANTGAISAARLGADTNAGKIDLSAQQSICVKLRDSG